MSFCLPQNPNFAVELNPDNTLCICEYLGSGQVMTIPEKIGKYTVTEIAPKFCEDTYNIISVVMPDTIREIGDEAFYACYDLRAIKISKNLEEIPMSFCQLTNIAEVNIPDSVHTINESAFRNCTRLRDINLGKNVKNINRWAFNNCPVKIIRLGPNVENIDHTQGCFLIANSLEKFIVDKDNPYFRDINGVLFSKDGKTLIRFPEKALNPADGSLLRHYTVPSCVRKIAAEAFAGCSVYNVKMHKNIKEIENCFSIEFAYDKSAHITCHAGSEAEKFAKRSCIKTKIAEPTIDDFLEELNSLETNPLK